MPVMALSLNIEESGSCYDQFAFAAFVARYVSDAVSV